MKTEKLFILFFTILIMSCQKEDGYDTSSKDHFTISSVERNESYPVWVYLPDGYKENNKTYQTIYLLDAEWDKEFVARKARNISQQMKTDNAVIVGIGYGADRMDDYSPTKTKDGDGKAGEFMEFIKNELIPKIENDYRVEKDRNSRCIIGHSLAGLCGAYAFTMSPEIFGNYIILSASFWWDDDIVLQYEQQNRKQLTQNRNTVYIGVGETEGPMIIGSKYFYEMLRKYYSHTTTEFVIINGKGHMTSKNDDIEKGLRFYFNNRETIL